MHPVLESHRTHMANQRKKLSLMTVEEGRAYETTCEEDEKEVKEASGVNRKRERFDGFDSYEEWMVSKCLG